MLVPVLNAISFMFVFFYIESISENVSWLVLELCFIIKVRTIIIKRHIKPLDKQKQIKLIIYYTKFKTTNLVVKNITNSVKILLNQTNVVYKFICPLRECLPKKKKDSSIGYTTTTLSRRLTNITFLKIAPWNI